MQIGRGLLAQAGGLAGMSTAGHLLVPANQMVAGCIMAHEGSTMCCVAAEPYLWLLLQQQVQDCHQRKLLSVVLHPHIQNACQHTLNSEGLHLQRTKVSRHMHAVSKKQS
jgi:hypothetical protein